jgi:hypothetical protein
MSIYGPFTACRLYLDAYDFTGDSREARIDYSAALLDATVFGATTKINAPGPKSIALTASGWGNFAAAAQDAEAFGNVGLSTPAAILMIPATAGAAVVEMDLAYFFQAAFAKYTIGGAYGGLLPFALTAEHGQSGYPLIRGYVGEPGTVQRAAGGNGTGSNALGALSAQQNLYAALCITQSSGGNLVVKVQSAVLNTFAGATDRITFSTVTTPGSQVATRVAGPITDTYWRVLWTLSAGTATFACAFGAQ